jgi:hypothetical protein
LKQNATMVLVPSTAVDSMQLGGVAGMAALAKELAGGQLNPTPPATSGGDCP